MFRNDYQMDSPEYRTISEISAGVKRPQRNRIDTIKGNKCLLIVTILTQMISIKVLNM